MKSVLTKMSVFFVLFMTLTFAVQGVASAHTVSSAPTSAKAAGTVNPLACPPTVGPGNDSATVKLAQEDLNANFEFGFFPNSPFNFHPFSQDPNNPLKVDGIFGANTTAATKDFQTLFAHPVDGVIGPITWHALGEC